MAKTASVDNTLLDLLNSSYPTQPHSLITNNYLTLFILTICENKHAIINVWGYPGPGGGVLQISSDRDDRMGAKIKTQTNLLGFKQNPKNSLSQTLTPKTPMPNFRAIKISRGTIRPGYAGTIISTTTTTSLLSIIILYRCYRLKYYNPQKIPT